MFDLFPHQAKAIADLREGHSHGHRRQVLGLATGGGKTVVAAHVAQGAVKKGRHVLFIVDRIELATQAADTFHKVGLRVGIMRGEDTCYSQEDDVIVASIQTIAKRGAPHWIDFIIIDECHCLHAEHIRLMESWNALPFIGLSATPMRKGLGKYFTNLVRGPTVRDLTEQGFLVPVQGLTHGAERIAEILAGVKAGTTTHGYDYNESALGDAMNRKELVGDIVGHWQKHGNNRPTLCFACNIAHSKAIAADFEAEGVTVGHIDAFTLSPERKRMIAGFRDGSIKILTSVYVLGVGFDVPDASCLILARPTFSEILHIQQLGRGIRTAPGKTDCIVLDHAGNTLRFGLPVHFEVPDLDDGKEKKAATRKARDKLKFVACSNCGGVMEPGQFSCTACGFDRPRPSANVETVDGELVEFGARSAAGPSDEDRKNWYRAMLWYAREHGHKPGSAGYKFKDKFGTWPPDSWGGLAPVVPTMEQAKWIKSRNIKYAKRKAA